MIQKQQYHARNKYDGNETKLRYVAYTFENRNVFSCVLKVDLDVTFRSSIEREFHWFLIRVVNFLFLNSLPSGENIYLSLPELSRKAIFEVGINFLKS